MKRLGRCAATQKGQVVVINAIHRLHPTIVIDRIGVRRRRQRQRRNRPSKVQCRIGALCQCTAAGQRRSHRQRPVVLIRAIHRHARNRNRVDPAEGEGLACAGKRMPRRPRCECPVIPQVPGKGKCGHPGFIPFTTIVDGTDYRIDLLFYHTILHSYIVIELKAGEFLPEYISKLNFYISAIDDKFCTPADEPTIGLLLCASKSNVKVEYSIRGLNKPIGVATYELGQLLKDKFGYLLDDIEK